MGNRKNSTDTTNGFGDHIKSQSTNTINGKLKNEERNKTEVNPDPEPSSSDLSSETSSSDSRANKKKLNKKKKCCKNQKDDLSDPSSSDDYDYSGVLK